MTTLSQNTSRSLEERTEYASVTESRESFLKLIDAVEAEPFRRHIVTKHGTPRAVLMSFSAYELLTRIAKQAVAEDDRKNAQEAARTANERMKAERWPEAAAARAGAQRAAASAAAAALAELGLTLVSKEDIKQISKQVVNELRQENRAPRTEPSGYQALTSKFGEKRFTQGRGIFGKPGFGKPGKGKFKKDPSFRREH